MKSIFKKHMYTHDALKMCWTPTKGTKYNVCFCKTQRQSNSWFWVCLTAVVGFSSLHFWTLVNHSFKQLLIIAWNSNLPKLSAGVSANNYSSKLDSVVRDGWASDKNKTYSKYIYNTWKHGSSNSLVSCSGQIHLFSLHSTTNKLGHICPTNICSGFYYAEIKL